MVEDYYFTKTHEWLAPKAANVVSVGITEHGQQLLGDIVHIELPEVGTQYTTGDELCIVESVKAASDIASPVSGTIIAVNDKLRDDPSQINHEPHVQWLCRIQLASDDELKTLLSFDDYQALTVGPDTEHT